MSEPVDGPVTGRPQRVEGKAGVAVSLTRRGRLVVLGTAVGTVVLGVQTLHLTGSGFAHAPSVTAVAPSSAPTIPPFDDDADCAAVDCVALTFDDGPSGDTSALLDVLRAHGAHATFFVVGSRVEERPEVVAEEVADGHEIGNHTWSHAHLTQLTPDEARSELTRTADVVQSASGIRPTLVRPPYGDRNDVVDALVGGPEILWTVDPVDFRADDPAAVATAVIGAAKPGSIILMHDTHVATVDAVGQIVDALRARGLHFVTVTHLLDNGPLEAGTAYFSR